jgi:ribose transport system permease protein
VWGTLAGVLIFGVLSTAFNQLGVNPYLKNVFQGLIIVLAVGSYTLRLNKEVS